MEGCRGCVFGGVTVEVSYEMPEELWLMNVYDLWRGARCDRKRKRRMKGMKAGVNEEFNVAGLLFHYVNETVQFVLGGVVECSGCL